MASASRLDAAQALPRGRGRAQCCTPGGSHSAHKLDALNLSDPLSWLRSTMLTWRRVDIILSNTFGANRYKLDEHGLGDQVGAINRAGLSWRAALCLRPSGKCLSPGDIGPLGVRLAPYGRVQAWCKPAKRSWSRPPWSRPGLDLLVIETMDRPGRGPGGCMGDTCRDRSPGRSINDVYTR